MKIEDVFNGNPTHLYMERYVNEGSKTYSRFASRSDAAPEYQPESETESYGLVCVQVPKASVSVYQDNPNEHLLKSYLRDDHVLFCIHPETWSSTDVQFINELHTFPLAQPIGVAPTSSTRTVLTTGYSDSFPAHFIKLHYPRRMSRFIRGLRKKNINNSIEGSKDLSHITVERFAYLPESLGFTYGTGDNAWGFLVRECPPRPYPEEPRYLIPYFSLYSQDRKQPDDPPLLIQLIEHLGADPTAFTLNEIILPVIECWVKVVKEGGLLLESHGQNILLEIDTQGHPRRVVHRDLDVWVDPQVRERAGHPVPFLGNRVGVDTDYPRQSYYSLIYDGFVGHHLFDYLAKVLDRFYSIKVKDLRRSCQEAFHGYFPDAGLFFPDNTTFYFSEEPLSGNKYKIIDMKQAPEWR